MKNIIKILFIISLITLMAISISAADYNALNDWILPWSSETKLGLTQGWNGSYSHVTTYNGICFDFSNGKNIPILAPAAGTVIHAGWDKTGYGNLVKIDTGKNKDDFIIFLAHLDSINVAVGQTVQQGAPIGIMGTTGRSTGIHIHFEIQVEGDSDVTAIRNIDLPSLFGGYTKADFAQLKKDTWYFGGNKGGGTTTPPPSQEQGIPRVISVTKTNNQSLTDLTLDKKETIIINTTSSTKKVKVVDSHDNIIGSASGGESSRWTIDITPKIVGANEKLKVYAGNDTYNTFNQEYHSIYVNVIGNNTNTDPIKVESAWTIPDVAQVGDYVDVIINTSKSATKVWIETNNGEFCHTTSSSNYYDESNRRVWKIRWQLGDDLGKRYLYAYASDKYGNEAHAGFNITVNAKQAVKPAVIERPTTNNSNPYLGETIIITVITNLEATKVCLVNESEQIISDSVQKSVKGELISGNKKRWLIPWKIEKTGNRQIAVYAGNDSSDYSWDRQYMYYIDINAKENIKPLIKSVSCEQRIYNVGDFLMATVKTNRDTEKVAFYNEYGEKVAEQTSYSMNIGTNEREWLVTWELGRAGARAINVRAGSSGYDYLSTTPSVIGVNAVEKKLSIIKIEVPQQTVYVGEYMYMTAVTTTDITNLWLRSDFGDSIIYEVSAPYIVANMKAWDVKWKPENSGNQTAVIIASNGSQTTEQSFTQYVNEIPKVLSINYDNRSYYVAETVTVKVITTSTTTKVCLVNEKNEMVVEVTSGYKTVGNTKEWAIQWKIGNANPYPRKIAIYAGNSQRDYTWDGQFMKYMDIYANNRTMHVYDVVVANSTVKINDYCWMTVTTSTDVQSIWVTNESGGDTVAIIESPTIVGSMKAWNVGWKLGATGYRTGYINISNGSSTKLKAGSFNCNCIN